MRALWSQEFVFLSLNLFTDLICVIHTDGLDTEVKVKIWEEKGGEKNKVCIVSSMKASI